jgi:putative resolvase
MASAQYIPAKEATKLIGVARQTLYKYEEKGWLDTIRTPGGKRLYNVQKYLDNLDPDKAKEIIIKVKICYCRVSTNGQKDDLERQVAYMKEKYPDYEIITDVGSGINFKRKGLQKIIDYAIKGILGELVIAYKDRLCRIGYDLIEHILYTYSGTTITIENDVSESINEEIANDLLSIVTVYSAKVNGRRSYAKKE